MCANIDLTGPSRNIDLTLSSTLFSIYIPPKHHTNTDISFYIDNPNIIQLPLQIPVLALVDSDPYGLKILSVYMSGSKSMSYDSGNLTTGDIKWLGVRPTDLGKSESMSMSVYVYVYV